MEGYTLVLPLQGRDERGRSDDVDFLEGEAEREDGEVGVAFSGLDQRMPIFEVENTENEEKEEKEKEEEKETGGVYRR